MFEDIKKNKIKSGIIVFGFILVVTLFIYYIAMALDFSGPVAIFIAMTFSIISSFASYYNSDKIILSVTKARPATLEEDRKIVHILDALMISSGLSHRPKLYVVEELDGFMAAQIKAAGIDCVGKDLVSTMYELNPQLLKEQLFGIKPETVDVGVKPVPRPPALCPGCPHRGFFYTMSKNKNYVIAGDIGCYTLGGAAPLSACDSVVCMGGGFSVGAGLAKALELSGQKEKKVFGVVGDSTFFHSGMTGAVEIIYNNAVQRRVQIKTDYSRRSG